MASPNRHPGAPPNCAQTIALDPDQDDEQVVLVPFRCAESLPTTPNYDFVEQPLQDFFCPVTMELLMEPQLTSCCGHHLSAEASARLQREGKACPMCNEQQWTAALDKYHRRRAREICVRCPHKRSGCDWEGEVGDLERHAASCPKRPWKCPHCAVRYTYGEGEGKHWPACRKFPEPCPNGCEVGSVERCYLEQHHKECPLEPVACEMREFGCSAVVPRKDLATHMMESELQHLTAMAVLNLRLTRQLQQDAAEKDEKIAQLQMEMAEQKEELKREIMKEITDHKEKITKEIMEQKEELKKEIIEQVVESRVDVKKELAEVKEGVVEKLSAAAHHIAMLTAGLFDFCNVFTCDKYSERKAEHSVGSSYHFFYLYKGGYHFMLVIYFYNKSNKIGVKICLREGSNDSQLSWPVKVKIHFELLNQAGNHHHVVKNKSWQCKKKEKDSTGMIEESLMTYADLEGRRDGVQYMMNDCLKFRLHLTVQAV